LASLLTTLNLALCSDIPANIAKDGQELLQVPARDTNVIHFLVPNAFLSASRSGAPSLAWMSGTARSSS
jgi:hypothetical protein